MSEGAVDRQRLVEGGLGRGEHEGDKQRLLAEEVGTRHLNDAAEDHGEDGRPDPLALHRFGDLPAADGDRCRCEDEEEFLTPDVGADDEGTQQQSDTDRGREVAPGT